uniref:Leucine-rich repeat-containing N-terminal plant-type domain-containing protein n=1 Tax=Salix viminalis TaxID=40686 RepID=A0A6N2K7B8_SALVM
MPSSVRFLTVRCFRSSALVYSSSMHPLCHEEESHALLQFKQSLVINESASSDPSSYPKVASWKVDGESRDCCSWDGVECDRDSGHQLLYGFIDSNSTSSTLFTRRLNLAATLQNSEILLKYEISEADCDCRESSHGIFQLPNLPSQYPVNPYLTGYLPNFSRQPLEFVLQNNFSGQLPESIGNSIIERIYVQMYFSGRYHLHLVTYKLNSLDLSLTIHTAANFLHAWAIKAAHFSSEPGDNSFSGDIPETFTSGCS